MKKKVFRKRYSKYIVSVETLKEKVENPEMEVKKNIKKKTPKKKEA